MGDAVGALLLISSVFFVLRLRFEKNSFQNSFSNWLGGSPDGHY
jgi:hypothetical protein